MTWIPRSATEWKSLLERRECSSEELTRAYIERIERFDKTIGSFLTSDAELAIGQARTIDERRGRGDAVGTLAGLPVAVKDVLCTRRLRTTCASRMLEHFQPPYDATVVSRVECSGGVLIGKTNLDEFAMGGSTENSAFHPARNPWDTTRVPGGSSGGAAACVAADLTPLSIGTDTGGSIRQPASYCGVVGLKPTYGRVSRYGLVAFASSLDQAGPMAWSVSDVALLLEAIAGHDPLDSTSAPRPVAAYSQTVDQPLKNLKLGVPREYLGDGVDAEVRSAVEAALEVYRRLGAELREVSLPHSRYGIAAYYLIAPCEASSNLARYDGVHYGYRTDENALVKAWEAERRELEHARDEAGLAAQESLLVRMYRRSRAEGFGAEVKRRIMLGTYALSAGYYDAYYLKALKVRRLIREDYDRAFEHVDFLLGPVAPTPAFPLGSMTDDPLSLYLQDLFTVGANLAGIPGISIPCGFTAGGLPIGLQIQGPAFEEERLLRAAAMYQRETEWHQRRPAIA
jgi:aspartyl-tRNA(Asn)/glutamyl-tRNA(Gln) amidotransferase subunit A